MDLKQYSPAKVLPHAPPMVLLDEISAWEKGSASAVVNITENSRFIQEPYGVPAYVGLEYMAQTCGIYSGLFHLKFAMPIHMGYLLGTRDFRCEVGWFEKGSRLVITVSEVLRQQNIGVFDCTIAVEDKQLAAAQLTVYQADAIA